MKRMFFLLIMLVMVKCAFGTEVSGHITQNTTWSSENNPYIVTAFLYVDAGVTLTILPGVHVEVWSADKSNIYNFYWSGPNQPHAKMIIVNGRIIAEGTKQSPITFNKFGDGANLRWGGIYMTPQAEECSYVYCEFRNSFFCYYIPEDWCLAVLDFDNGRINVRSCLFDNNLEALRTGNLNEDMLVYDCKFISVNNTFPTPFAGPGFFGMSADPNQIPADYFKVTIARCYFKGDAAIGPVGYYMEIFYLNNVFDNYIASRQSNAIRLEDFGSVCDYGNLAIQGKSGFGCGSTSPSDTVFSRRNKIFKISTGGVSSTIGGSGVGTNYITDNYLEGVVQFLGQDGGTLNTYFSNNVMVTTSALAIDISGTGAAHTGHMRIFNNVFRNIDPDSTDYEGMIRSSYISPMIFNNTFTNYYTIMDGDLDADHFTNNVLYNFSDFNAGSLSSNNPPIFVHNCLNLPFPEWGMYMDGGGNIIADPLFVDEENGDFQLQPGSPCIDAGIPLADLPEYDIRYYKRTVFGTTQNTVDMGAYEYNSVYIGGIQGFVYDEQTGLPIDCVKIAIHDKLPEFSDTLGCFPFNTGAGTYTVTASRWDYEDVVIPNVVVNEGEYTILNIPMNLTSTGIEEEIHPEVCGTTLCNYPNPFNPSTTISFSIPKVSHVNLCVYNIKGQKVVQLIDENMPLGQHRILWDGENENHKAVGSGMYFIRLEAEKQVSTRKVILMK